MMVFIVICHSFYTCIHVVVDVQTICHVVLGCFVMRNSDWLCSFGYWDIAFGRTWHVILDNDSDMIMDYTIKSIRLTFYSALNATTAVVR